MKTGKTNWTEAELEQALHLYCRISYGQISARTPEIVQLAARLGRTAGSIALKLSNFVRLDSSLANRGVKGFENGSKLDVVVWDKFFNKEENKKFLTESGRLKELDK